MLDLDVAAARILADLERRGILETDLGLWAGTWPPGPVGGLQVLRVDPDPNLAGIARMTRPDAPATFMCMLLRHRYDSEGADEWTFIPGRSGVLLARLGRTSVCN